MWAYRFFQTGSSLRIYRVRRAGRLDIREHAYTVAAYLTNTHITTLEDPVALAIVIDLVPEPQANERSPSDVLEAR